MKHEKYDEFFTLATVIQAEGARIGIATCTICGAAVLLDPRDNEYWARHHVEWHEAQALAEHHRILNTKP